MSSWSYRKIQWVSLCMQIIKLEWPSVSIKKVIFVVGIHPIYLVRSNLNTSPRVNCWQSSPRNSNSQISRNREIICDSCGRRLRLSLDCCIVTRSSWVHLIEVSLAHGSLCPNTNCYFIIKSPEPRVSTQTRHGYQTTLSRVNEGIRAIAIRWSEITTSLINISSLLHYSNVVTLNCKTTIERLLPF